MSCTSPTWALERSESQRSTLYRAAGGPDQERRRIDSYRDTALAQVPRVGGPAMHDSVSPADSSRSSGTVAFLWLTFPDTGSLPSALRHRLTFAILDSADVRRDGAPSRYSTASSLKLSGVVTPLFQAPLRGGVVAGGRTVQRLDHRRSITAVRGPRRT